MTSSTHIVNLTEKKLKKLQIENRRISDKCFFKVPDKQVLSGEISREF